MNLNQCLIIVDVQNDFLSHGALSVPNGEEVIAPINDIVDLFDTVVYTQDWHPENHISFASNHSDRKILDVIELDYGTQVLWPNHCVENTKGAELASNLKIASKAHFVKKGIHSQIDSYSGFLEADRKTPTGLAEWLKARGIKQVFICGLATDFCVSWTALDAKNLGFDVLVIEDACRGLDINDSIKQEKLKWQANGIKVTSTEKLPHIA